MSSVVTVVIPTLNAGPGFRTLLALLASQTLPFDIVVMDSSSSDGTVELAKTHGARVVTIARDEFDHGGTRSLAMNYASTEFIVYLTQDAVPANERAVENLIKAFDDERVGAAYGRQLPRPDADPFAAHMRLFKYPAQSRVKSVQDKDLHGIDTPALSNSFAAYRKKALEEIGLFKKGALFAEDVQAGARLLLSGYKIAYVADALAYHSHNHSMVEEFKRYFDNGVFYQTEQWIRDKFGNNRGEGWRYLRSELRYLRQNGHYRLLPQALVRDFFRLTGYGLGLNHRRLPRGLCRKMSVNKAWWDKVILERR